LSQKIFVLAGGLGSRISHLYPDLPKALIPVYGKPFISWKISQLHQQGFEEICFLIGHKANQIEDYLNSYGSTSGISWKYDGETLKGTGGAVLSAIKRDEERFVLTFGDNLLPLDIERFNKFCLETSASVMTVTSYCGPSDTPNVDVVDSKVVQYKKSSSPNLTYVDYGLYSFLTEDLVSSQLNSTSSATIDLSMLLNNLIDRQILFGHKIAEPYYEIGTSSGIFQTEQYLKDNLN
jgi:NDP-sugar pyrophosphorylase family protein